MLRRRRLRRRSYFVEHDGLERFVRHHDSIARAERAGVRHGVREVLGPLMKGR